MGTKIILALIVFLLASVLVGRSARFEPLRRDRKKWLLITIVLAFVIVLISSYLRIRGVPAWLAANRRRTHGRRTALADVYQLAI